MAGQALLLLLCVCLYSLAVRSAAGSPQVSLAAFSVKLKSCVATSKCLSSTPPPLTPFPVSHRWPCLAPLHLCLGSCSICALPQSNNVLQVFAGTGVFITAVCTWCCPNLALQRSKSDMQDMSVQLLTSLQISVDAPDPMPV